MSTDQSDYEDAVEEAIALGLFTAGGQATDRAQCPTCGQVFSTDVNFRRHLTPERYAIGFDGPWCQDPANVGLVQHERGWWQLRGPQVDLAALRAAS